MQAVYWIRLTFLQTHLVGDNTDKGEKINAGEAKVSPTGGDLEGA